MSGTSKESSIIESHFQKDSEEKIYTTSVVSFDDESEQSLNNPFVNEKIRERYTAMYEESQYECRHRFDPNFKWSKEAEKKLTWKLDLKVTVIACFFFTALQIDRSNMTQAVSDNLLDDLGLTTNDYNTAHTIFFLCFLAAELPSQLVSKRLGADVWIPIQMTAWSLVTICQFKLSGKTGLYVCRALLGFFEGGFIPDLVLWLSYFYTSKELTIRLSYFWTTMYCTTILNYIMAYGILHLRGVHGHPGWAWLFLIEGLLTFAIGISAFFLMRPSVVQTKTRWNPKGWFTEEEEKIIVNKILRDDPSKGDMHNRQGISFRMLWDAICDWHLWPMYAIGIIGYIPEKTTGSYMTLLLRGMGFDVFHTNLLCIPFNVIKLLMLLFVSYYSEYISNIFGVALLQPIWTAICVGVLRFWSGTYYNKWGTYAVLTVMLGDPYIHAMMVSATSRNSSSIKTRTVSASVYNMFVQAGSIIGSNIYRKNDKPLYHTGNTVLLVFALFFIVLLLCTKAFYWKINKKRAEKWDAMTEAEKDHYIENSTDNGSSRLDFRFAH